MLKFFRIARRKLLREGNLKKYLVYAVGEIILIVVGILIALQINNWNEENTKSKLANQYKKSLLRDMKLDIESIEVRINNANERIAGAERLLQLLEKGKDYEDYQKREDLLKSGWLNFFVPHFNTYNDLISSGNIKLIKDDSLKLLLNDYVNHCERILLYEDHDKNNVWEQYGEYYRKWIDGRMSAAYLVQDSIKFVSYPVDWKAISLDNELRHRMTLTIETGYGQVARYTRVKQKIAHLTKYLENH